MFSSTQQTLITKEREIVFPDGNSGTPLKILFFMFYSHFSAGFSLQSAAAGKFCSSLTLSVLCCLWLWRIHGNNIIFQLEALGDWGKQSSLNELRIRFVIWLAYLCESWSTCRDCRESWQQLCLRCLPHDPSSCYVVHCGRLPFVIWKLVLFKENHFPSHHIDW